MNSLSQAYAALRKNNRRQYTLLAGCLFFSVLLITAYCLIMRSPTILSVLPEGGDSRRQVMMIFALAIIGCGAFTIYASGLFFREKSRETGIFLALGAAKSTLARQLRKEIAIISLTACVLGMALGLPLSWLVWNFFRLTLANTEEMRLFLDLRAYGIALAFSAFAILALFLMLSRFLKRTNIIDIVSEVHRSEPIRRVPQKYGPVGIILLVGGLLLGYMMPGIFINGLHWYPPAGLAEIAYLPALIGLYMILLHTVVNGWRRGESRYKNIVTTSMMQFQGRQTVRNMLVITVLLAGAYFSAFYVPMMSTGAMMSFDQRPVDYAFTYRIDQDMPSQTEIEAMAKEEGVTITDYVQQPIVRLGIDGIDRVETEGKMGITYEDVYLELCSSRRFLSESAWNALTGDGLDLAPGTNRTVYTSEGEDAGRTSNSVAIITNPVTGQALSTTPIEPALRHDLLFGYCVIDDSDYKVITQGLSPEWQEIRTFFNVANAEDTYAFAKRLYYEIVDRSGQEVSMNSGWDPVVRQRCIDAGETYFLDPEHVEEHGIPAMRYDQRDSSTFRLNWMYMPEFRVLDKADFNLSMAVWLLLFVFISILCFAAVAVILFTRSLTIAMTNAWVYDDLRHLGAPNRYLLRVVRGQISRIFFAPILTGTLLILALYLIILLFNSGFSLSLSEILGLKNCLIVTAIASVALYGFYRLTLAKVCHRLKISLKS